MKHAVSPCLALYPKIPESASFRKLAQAAEGFVLQRRDSAHPAARSQVLPVPACTRVKFTAESSKRDGNSQRGYSQDKHLGQLQHGLDQGLEAGGCLTNLTKSFRHARLSKAREGALRRGPGHEDAFEDGLVDNTACTDSSGLQVLKPACAEGSLNPVRLCLIDTKCLEQDCAGLRLSNLRDHISFCHLPRMRARERSPYQAALTSP